jgi:hypothetical protein
MRNCPGMGKRGLADHGADEHQGYDEAGAAQPGDEVGGAPVPAQPADAVNAGLILVLPHVPCCRSSAIRH